jgi:hypothetical protein
LQIKRDRAQRLAVKRGLSDNLSSNERPRSASQGSLMDAIPLRRGRSSTLQSQVSDVVPLRGRSSTLGSQSSGLTSPRVEPATQPTPAPSHTNAGNQTPVTPSSAYSKSSLHSLNETNSPPAQPPNTGEESEFTEFIAAEEPPPGPYALHSPSNNGSESSTAPLAAQTGSSQPAAQPPLPIPSTPPPVKSSQEITSLYNPTSNDLQHLSSNDRNLVASAVGPGTEPSTLNISVSQTSALPIPPRNTPERLVIRRSPSKVPSDYDPVTGYYRHKSDASDLGVDEEG